MSSRFRFGLLGVLLVSASLPVLTASASQGQASLACPSPGVLSGSTCTYTFLANAPTAQTLAVPANVMMTITADGAPGGSGEENSGALDGTPGLGGQSAGTFKVTSAETLTVLVGDVGTQAAAGGEGGGGFGDSNFGGSQLEQGGKGGGGSYVFGPANAPLVIAGGGGGTGSGNLAINQLGGAGGGDGPGGKGSTGAGSGPGTGGGAGGTTSGGGGGAAGPSGGGTPPQSGQAGKRQ